MTDSPDHLREYKVLNDSDDSVLAGDPLEVATAVLEGGVTDLIREVNNSMSATKTDIDSWHEQPGAKRRKKKAKGSIGALCKITLDEAQLYIRCVEQWPVDLAFDQARHGNCLSLCRLLEAWLVEEIENPKGAWPKSPWVLRVVTSWLRCMHVCLLEEKTDEERAATFESFKAVLEEPDAL